MLMLVDSQREKERMKSLLFSGQRPGAPSQHLPKLGNDPSFLPSLQWKPGGKLLQERWISGENLSLPKGFLELLQGPHSSICKSGMGRV